MKVPLQTPVAKFTANVNSHGHRQTCGASGSAEKASFDIIFSQVLHRRLRRWTGQFQSPDASTNMDTYSFSMHMTTVQHFNTIEPEN